MRKRRKKSFQRRRGLNQKTAGFEKLEPRNLLAGLFLDTGTGDLTVIGDGGDNIGQVRVVNSNLIRAEVDGIARDFDVSQVSRLVFVGFGGDDQFTNNTAINGAFYGHAGNDTIIGGAADEILNGGAGDDQLFGNAGADLLLGVGGVDNMSGGQGNDRMFGGDGLNTIDGGDDDDVIFGGNDADVINGGNGIDKIYGLAGDDLIDSGAGGVPTSNGVEFADLVLGLDGDDTITGGGGLDVFWGGNGNDTLVGGGGENRLHGQNDNDTITGNAFADYLTGGSGNDTIDAGGGKDYVFGHSGIDLIRGGDGDDELDGGSGDDSLFGEEGDDRMRGGIGDDTLDGGPGVDWAIYENDFSDYRVTGQIGDLVVHDRTGFDGTNDVDNVEGFVFADGERSARPTASQVVTIQPIVLSNSDGTNASEYMGSSFSENYIKSEIDEIYAQAFIDIEWLPVRGWNDTFANVGTSNRRPESDLNQIVSSGDNSGRGNNDPLVIDMYFVEVVPGFRNTSENTANGLAFVDANGVAVHVGDDLVDFQNGRDVAARVIAHEIAHNLGLSHINDPNNLMDDGREITAEQAQVMLDSRYSRSA